MVFQNPFLRVSMSKERRMEKSRFLLRFIAVVIFKNGIASKLRSFLKKHASGGSVRVFDGLRKTRSEKKYEDITNGIEAIERGETHYGDVISFLINDLLLKYKSDGLRPDISRIHGLDADSLTTEQWLKVYFSFFSSGLLLESAILRSKAVSSCLREYAEYPGDITRRHIALSALVELEWDVQKIKSAVGNMSNEFELLIKNESVASQSVLLSDFENENFSKLLNGKRIAIIGPSASKTLDAEELGQFDLLITTNEHGDNPIVNEFISKGKCISYYNSYHSKLLHQERGLRPYDTSLFSVYRAFEYDYQVYQALRDHARKIHKNDHFFNGVPQAFQAILHDISHFDFLEVKAFGFDLYASAQPYRSGYKSPTHRVLYDLGRHDLISNFLYTKSFFDSGRLEADDSLRQVLNLDLSEYLEKVETCIVHW